MAQSAAVQSTNSAVIAAHIYTTRVAAGLYPHALTAAQIAEIATLAVALAKALDTAAGA